MCNYCCLVWYINLGIRYGERDFFRDQLDRHQRELTAKNRELFDYIQQIAALKVHYEEALETMQQPLQTTVTTSKVEIL